MFVEVIPISILWNLLLNETLFFLLNLEAENKLYTKF